MQHYFQALCCQPNTTMLRVNDESSDRASICQAATELAIGLQKQGITCGDVVALVLPNSIFWYQAYLAINAIGALPMPIDPQAGKWEVANYLRQTNAKLCIICNQYRSAVHDASLAAMTIPVFTVDTPRYDSIQSIEALRQPGQLTPVANSCLMLACTSGTTGNAKIISVPQAGFLKSQQDMAKFLSLTPDDCMLLGMPLYHQGGFGMGMQAILAGASVIYQAELDPEAFLSTISEQKVSIVQLTPTVARLLLSLPNFAEYDISSLRLAYFAGEVLDQTLAETFSQSLNIPVVNIIGSSETGTMVAWDSRTTKFANPSIFEPLPFSGVAVLDDQQQDCQEGELWVHTDAVLLEYHGNPELSAQNIRIDELGQRWFATGDLVKRIDDQAIQFIGRQKRAIKRGANLIHPEEVEAFLVQHAGIQDACVVSQAHEVFGEQVIAYLVVTPGRLLTRGNILQYCLGRIAAYKVPDKIIFVDQLPEQKGKRHLQQVKGLETDEV
ncbi:class I adenylate-forming enzyme family protein [Salinibius halmophilus]|uniref:class I adenylate-forming enzyme family protein n=1 Tax=Salinibius halmophilus TaxID=1853216 RepID=UPI000E662245|nr:class I adenylate-forming enzyme family protein [Salinibius halmophilus]